MSKLHEAVQCLSKVKEAESNSIVRGRIDDIHTDGPIPVDPLIVLNGRLNGVNVSRTLYRRDS